MTPQQIETLERLANLKAQGALSAAEFEKQKSILLGQQQPEQNENVQASKQNSAGNGCAIAMIGAVVIVVFGLLLSLGNGGESASASSSANVPAPPQASIGIGDQGYTRGHSTNGATLGGSTKADFDNAMQRLSAKDFLGLARIIRDGEVTEIPAGTKVLVTDRGLSWKRVRCLDGALSGAEYYIASDAVAAH